MPKQPAITDYLEAYAETLLRHHLLVSDGKEENPKLEEVEDQLGRQWENLDKAQQEQMRGLSSDLNWIRRGYAQAPKAKAREQVAPDELREFY